MIAAAQRASCPVPQYLAAQKKLFDAKKDAGFRKVGSGN